MAFKLPDLPYAFDALEPAIDAQTMQIHHGKHHAAYVNNLNKALEGRHDLEAKGLEDLCRSAATLPADARSAVRNNAGGHWNHAFFWEAMAPKGRGGNPSADLQRALDADLGGLAKLKETFAAAATGRFGSGWAWVLVNEQGKLQVTSTQNQDNPLMRGVQDPYGQAVVLGTPVLGLDVWEHAYYLKYQNRRPDYVTAWWDVVSWSKASENFARARK